MPTTIFVSPLVMRELLNNSEVFEALEQAILLRGGIEIPVVPQMKVS